MSELIGRELGPYRLAGQIGAGGMATVYKAYHAAMDRYVAVKVLPVQLGADAELRQRFERESRVIARLEHAHILPVYDYGQAQNRLYLVMRYIGAGTLKDRLARGPMDLVEVNRIMQQVGGALEYAHQQGVVHRDVKPSNVLLDAQGECYLTDFGLAKVMEASVQLTATGVGLGTPAYMSPEQGQGTGTDVRSDIYSLGVMLYEMVTGRVPYEAETPLAVVLQHISAPLPLPSSIRPGIPQEVERVILKAMAKDPGDRFRTVQAMVTALNTAMTDASASAALPGTPDATQWGQRTAPVAPRRSRALGPWLWAAAGMGLVAVVALTTWAVVWGPFGGRTKASENGPAVTPKPSSLIYVSSGQRQSGNGYAGGSSCCGCRVRHYGRLPSDFPAGEVSALTFSLGSSLEDSYYTRVRSGPTRLRLVLGDRESAATSAPASDDEGPSQARWSITFTFDPPVRMAAETKWQLLDGDENLYSAVLLHSSDAADEGLPGKYEVSGCQYTRTVNMWYSVRFIRA